jgi:lysozyme family protein
MTNFEMALKSVLNIEAGYVNDKYDNGGATNYGITEQLARKYGYTGDMHNLSKELAIEIYKKEFWDRGKFYLIEDSRIATELFEFSVNSGDIKLAVKFLQRAYNSLNNNIIKEDGILGPITAKYINNFKYPKLLVKMMNVFQGMYYCALVEENKIIMNDLKNHKETLGNKKYKHFIKGWINKRITL